MPTKPAKAQADKPKILQQHSMVPRLGEPGRTYAETDATGITVEITADARGIVRPGSTREVRVADLYKLPAAPGVYAFQRRPGEAVQVATIAAPSLTTAAEQLGLDPDDTTDTDDAGDAGAED